jgi:hypothetical protein
MWDPGDPPVRRGCWRMFNGLTLLSGAERCGEVTVIEICPLTWW